MTGSAGLVGPSSDRRAKITLAFLLLGQLSIVASLGSINLTLPQLRGELGASPDQLQWMVVSEQLAYAIVLIVGGRLGDIFGRRRLYLLGLALFTLASLLAAAATEPWMVIAARLVQGMAGGLATPQVLAVIRIEYEGRDRTRAYAAFSLVSGLGFMIGQLGSGFLISANPLDLGWRVPFAVTAVGTAVAAIGAAAGLRRSTGRGNDRIDYLGCLASAAVGLLILYPLIQGRSAGWPPSYLIAMASALPVAWLFVRRQRRLVGTGRALVDVRLFDIRTFRVALALGAAFSLAAFAPFFVLAYTLQSGFGYSALETAIYTSGGPLCMIPASLLATRAIVSLGRWVYVLGSVLSMISTAMLYVLISGGPPGQPAWLAVATAFQGFGQGLFLPATTIVLMADVPPRDSSAAAGVHQTVSQFGGAVGVAGFGAVYFGVLGAATSATSATRHAEAYTAMVPAMLVCSVVLMLVSVRIPARALHPEVADIAAPGEVRART